MSSGRMDQGPGDQTPDELLARYEQASALDDARPGAHVRVAVLAHARAVAQAQQQGEASNSPSWRLQALGSLAIIGLVGMLYLQFDRGSEDEREAAFGAGSQPAAPPVVVAAPVAAVDAVPAAKEAATAPSIAATTRSAAAGAAPSPPAAAPPAARAAALALAPALVPVPTMPAAAERAPAQAPAEGQAQRQTLPRDAAQPAADLAKAGATQRQEALAAPVAELAAPAPALAPAPARTRAPTPASEAGADRSGSGTLASRRFAAESASLAQALRQAALVGDTAQIETLIARGAQLEAADEAGRTPLLLAVMQGQRAAVTRLLAAGANARAQDREGVTALRHAQSRAFAEIETLLRQHGAH